MGDNIVGMDFHLEQLKSMMKTERDDVNMVGIYGIGGIGKTTMAMAIYNDISCHDPIWGIVTGAREWEGVRPPKPVASLTEILIPTIMRSPDNISTYIYNMLRCQTSIGNINRET